MCNVKVYESLLGDWDVSQNSDVAFLLGIGVNVLVYNGDKDFICNWRGGDAWTYHLQWPH